ncbi:hypothetical protein JNMOADIG_00170 [Aeromonas phage avDM5]|uniref:Uncharacterized protein n=1 Tax=Aeromonas phage vB_AehM_DM2 TaxID=2973716 RepID=A0AA94YHV3_9CAUD|nr:hypothetical protein JNMOADIG_00170 [Aeromonas phage avDM5]UYD60588.1 hypothetical protein NPHMPGLK_00253 [Aeromonas phage avDM2]UYD60820.1 hypothetical protein NHNEHLNL_00241 [Aeromonas phage avDM2]
MPSSEGIFVIGGFYDFYNNRYKFVSLGMFYSVGERVKILHKTISLEFCVDTSAKGYCRSHDSYMLPPYSVPRVH